MLGLFGAAIFGIVAAGAWSSAENQEQKQRKMSRENGYSFYTDKNGRLRNTQTGRKLTPEEVHQTFYPKTITEISKEFEEKRRD